MCGKSSSPPNYGTPAPQQPTTFKSIDPAVEYSQQQKQAATQSAGNTSSFGAELGGNTPASPTDQAQ